MKPLTFSILQLLSDRKFRSGETIAKDLGISRASVSYALRELDETGVTVQKVHGRGYRLCEPVQWLNRDAIMMHLGREAQGFNLEIFDIVESTNSLLFQKILGLALQNNPAHVIAAELQTRGRGRRGRQWHSGLGNALTFSLLWQFQQGASLLSGLSLTVGVAIIRAFKSNGIEGAVLKWPNDVIFNFCKLAGILIELQGDMLGPTIAVIGVGVNLDLPRNVKARIDQAATGVASINGAMPDRNKLLAALLAEIAGALKEFERHGFSAFREEWTNYHVFEKRNVTLRLPDGTDLKGLADGVADNGSLLLRTAEGVRGFSSGEISLRPNT
jgi:BirA family transcriptional regulator, biotin operon repressor / biotin---[acetyl-CoA-carboxylase] ligase